MSDLFRVSIDGKQGTTFHGRVHVVHPDAGDVPPGHDFALKIILEVWHRMREGYFFDHPKAPDRLPGGLDEGVRIANGIELHEEFERLRALDRGAHVVLTEEQAEEIRAAGKIADRKEKSAATRRLMERYGVKRLGVGLLDGSHYLTGERDPEAFYARAREVVTEYGVGEMRSWPPYWEYEEEDLAEFEEAGFDDPADAFDIAAFRERAEGGRLEDYPYAEFTVTVADVRYLEHMAAGIHLATAIYGEFGW